MRNFISYALYAIVLMGFVFQSCTDDGLTDFTTDELRGGRPGNNNGDGDNDGHHSHKNGDVELFLEWTDLFVELDRYATGMRPNAIARAIAYINLAVYETMVPDLKSKKSAAEELEGLFINSDNLSNDIEYEIAMNACYARVLDHFLINLPSDKRALISELRNEKLEDLSNNESQNTITESIEWGEYVALQVIEYSQTDTEAETQILDPQPISYEPPVGDGFWTYSADPERALFPYWESVRTFIISPDETTTVDPIPYSEDENSEYYAQMQEVYEVNNTARETENEDLWIAEFWSDDVEGLMMSPPGRQVSIARQLIKKEDLSLSKTLALFVKLGFSLNDAAVSTWKYKYEHMVMRPTEYVRVFIDPEFQTNLYKFIYWPNPSFPGYPSGHSCFASAAAGVFIDFVGNEIKFTDRSHEGRTEFLGEPRTFNSLEDLAEENAFSRIPLGVHVRMDCEEGLRLGYEIADAINEFSLEKEHN